VVKFFFVTILSLFVLILIFVIYGIGVIIYIVDGVALTLDYPLLHESRYVLRDFLYTLTNPIFAVVIVIMLSIAIVGLFSNKLRHRIDESLYTLRTRPINPKNVTVVLPAYNEEAVIGGCVEEFLTNKYVKHVLVVDNNSKDNTVIQAQKFGAEIITETNQGYGFACLRGLKEALKTDSEIIVLCEGDGTQNGKDLDKLMSYIDNCDMVIGTRTVRSLLENNTQMSQFYMWGNYFIALLIGVKYFNPIDISYVRLTDAGCTFRAIRRDALKKIISNLEPKIHTFALHMIIEALEHDLTIVEVPVTFRKRIGESKGAGGKKSLGFQVGLSMIMEILTR